MASSIGHKISFNAATAALFYGTGKLAYWTAAKTANLSYSYLLAPVFRSIATHSPNILKKGAAPVGDLAGRIGCGLYSAIPGGRLMTLAKVVVAASSAFYFRKAALELAGQLTLSSAHTLNFSSATQKKLMNLFIRCGILEKGCIGAVDALFGKDLSKNPEKQSKNPEKHLANLLIKNHFLDAFEALLDHAISVKDTSNALPDFKIEDLSNDLGINNTANKAAGLIQRSIENDLGWFSLTETKLPGLSSNPSKKRSLVNWAMQHNCLDFVKWVESRGADMEYVESAYTAAASGSCKTLSHLLTSLGEEWPADKRAFNAVCSQLWYHAALSNNSKIITTLSGSTNVSKEALHVLLPDLHVTPLQYALCCGSSGTIEALDAVVENYAQDTELVQEVASLHLNAPTVPPTELTQKLQCEIGDTPLMLLIRRIKHEAGNSTENTALIAIASIWIKKLSQEDLSTKNREKCNSLTLATLLLGKYTRLTNAIRTKLEPEEG